MSWWDTFVENLRSGAGGGFAGYAPQTFSTVPTVSVQDGRTFLDVAPVAGASAGRPSTSAGARPATGDRATAAQRRAETRPTAASARRQAAQMPPAGPSEEDLAEMRRQYILENLSLAFPPGGGGVNLSGYNELLGDIGNREAALGTRRGEQEEFLASLFGAAQTRAEADREALAAAVESQLASDSARRATDIGLVRGEEAARRETVDAARGALGVMPGEDLTSEVMQNTVGGIGASGSVADRDARIRQSIGEQQFGREIAGLAPMQQAAMFDLNRLYEDRLSGLESERSALMAQIAQARASGGGGSRGPSLSDLFMLEDRANAMFGPGESPELPSFLRGVQGIESYFGQGTGNTIISLGDRVLSTALQSNVDVTRPAALNEIIGQLRRQDPAMDAFLNSTPTATGALTAYVTEVAKGFGSIG